MKSFLRSVVGFAVSILQYETISEVDKDAKKEGTALEIVNDHLYYHGEAAEARSVVAEGIEAITKIARPTRKVTKDTTEVDPATNKPKTDADGKVLQVPVVVDGVEQTEYTQSDADYIKFALLKSGKTVEQLQPDLDKWIANRKDEQGKPLPPLAVSAAYTERQAPKPKVLAEKYLKSAQAALAAGKVKAWAKDFNKVVGRDIKPEALTDATALGWEIKLFSETVAANALAIK